MAALDSIVSVVITRETSVPTRQGFGEGAFVSANAVFEEYIKIYSSATEVANDSLAGADTIAAANVYFGQEIRPERFFVIKKGRDLPHIQLVTFAGAFVAGNTVDMKVDGAPITQVPFNSDSDTTLQDVATSIAAEASVATAVADTAARTILVTGAADNDSIPITEIVVAGGASQTTGSAATTQYQDEVKTYVESIQRAQQVNDEWYALAINSKSAGDQEDVADYLATLIKLFFMSTYDFKAYDAGDATDIGSLLKAKSYDRAVMLYSEDDAAHAEVAYMGGQLPKDPGSITWAFKELKGVAVDTLTTTQKSALLGKNYNVYTEVAGLNITEQGKVASGEFIDIMRGTDFIQVRLQEAVFTLLANAPKVPFTDQGISQVENEVRSVLRLATNQDILASDPEFTVTVPKAADVSLADKGNRLLPDVNFTGVYAGAVHKVEIQGTLSL